MVNSLDVVIIIIILAGVYLGYTRGLLAEVIALVGVVFGISMAARFYLQAAQILQPLLRDEKVTYFIAFLVLYWLAVLAFFLIHLVIKSNMAGGVIGPLNRLVAAVIGGVKNTVFVVMVLFLVIFFWGPENYLTSGAKLMPRFLPDCRIVVNLLPANMQVPLEEFLDELSQNNEPGDS